MDKAAVIERLRAHEAELRAMGVESLSLFGSVARGEAEPGSDVDVALTLDPSRRLGLFRYALIGERLEDILGVAVDTVSEPVEALRLQRRIEQDRALSSSKHRLEDLLADIIENIDRVEAYAAGLNLESFRGASMARDAIERCIERIAEAAVRIGAERLAAIAPDTVLHEVRGLRNRLRHEYGRIDARLLWDLIEQDLPPLRVACERALAGRGKRG